MQYQVYSLTTGNHLATVYGLAAANELLRKVTVTGVHRIQTSLDMHLMGQGRMYLVTDAGVSIHADSDADILALYAICRKG